MTATQVKDVLMRIQPWLKALAGAALAFWAQLPACGQDGFGAYPADGAYGGAPAAVPYFQPPYGNNDPSIIYPPAIPQTYQPWPAISPFQSANIGTDQHLNRDGLWFRRQMYKKRTYYGSVEGMAVWFRDAGEATVGSRFMTIDPESGEVRGVDVDPNTVGGLPVIPTIAPGQPGRFPVEDAVFPFPALDATAGIFNATSRIDFHPIRTAGNIPDPQAAPGIMLRWGFEDEDGTGVQTNVWWAFEGESSFQRGADNINGIPVSQALTISLGGLNLSTQFGNVPLDNGEFLFPFSGTGSTAKYDVMYRLQHETEAGGTNLSYYLQPIVEGDGLRVRPSLGARYMYISEGFSFRGIDSGFNYDVDAIALGGGGGGGQQQAQLFRPVTASLAALYQQYEATLSNSISTHLAGPEVGLRFDLGDSYDGFRVWGETNLAVVANHQQFQLEGDNIGDPLVDARLNLNTPPRMLDPANESQFASTANTTRVAPIFSQSFNADFHVLDDIPVLRDTHIFQNATLRLGYTFTWIGNIARPADSIHWQGFPLFPQIRAEYEPWWMHSFNAGIDWEW